MANETKGKDEPIPAGQKFFDNEYLLLALGILVPGALYLAWGIWDVLSIPLGK